MAFQSFCDCVGDLEMGKVSIAILVQSAPVNSASNNVLLQLFLKKC